MILEGKNEFGTTRLFKCPYTTVTIGLRAQYVSLWSCSYMLKFPIASLIQSEKVRSIYCCTTFGVAITGPWMCILGAVLLDKAMVEPLTPLIPLRLTLPDDESLGYIILEALRLSLAKLDTFYKGLVNSNDDGQQRYFPHFRTFMDTAHTPIPFTYISQLTEEPTRLVWKAMVTQNQHLIVVKFTKRPPARIYTTMYCRLSSCFTTDNMYLQTPQSKHLGIYHKWRSALNAD